MPQLPDLLPISPKWADRKWAIGQLRSHLVEVLELLDANDPHFENELADLAMIAAHIAQPERVAMRFQKFIEKARTHDRS